jgi:hypothetical protein
MTATTRSRSAIRRVRAPRDFRLCCAACGDLQPCRHPFTVAVSPLRPPVHEAIRSSC